MSRIRADQLVNRAGSGGPKFPNGVAEGFSVSGVVTATSYRGDGSQLTGIDASSLKDGSNVKVQAVSGGANVTGNVAATGNVTAVDVTASGNVTAVDGTFSGNLTVQGTTTTIDTAVTSVDSLAVDGSVGIGTTNPGIFNGNADDLVIFGTGHQGLTIRSGAAHDGSIMFNDTDNANQRGIIRYIHTDDAMAFHTSGGEALRINQHKTTKFKGPLTEKCHYDTGGGLQSDYHHDLITHGNVYWSDTAAAGAFTFNLRGSATVALNDMMDTGESLSFWFAHACHGTTSHYMTAFKVDGTTISGGNIIWSGGSAPSAAGGGSGTKDVYTFTVFKVGNNSFRAFAAQTNHT